MTVEMKRLKVREMIRQVEIAVKTVEMMNWLKLCLLALVNFATRVFQPEATKNIMKTMCTRKTPKVHTLAKLIQGVKRSSPTRLHCGIIS